VQFNVLDLVGDSYSRGFAYAAEQELLSFISFTSDLRSSDTLIFSCKSSYGKLLSDDILQFFNVDIPTEFYATQYNQVDISKITGPTHDILQQLMNAGPSMANQFFEVALDWVWDQEQTFVPRFIMDEMRGVADGLCAAIGASCDPDGMLKQVHRFNMLPELIRMTCTMFGAWGQASSTHGLIQLRALDFGPGPFARHSVLAIYRDNPANPDHSFVSLSFAGMVGAVTGIAQNGIGISEKVWMTNMAGPDELQDGSFNGTADIFVLRDILENAKNVAQADTMLNYARRTWGIWIGIGDFESQAFNIVGYRSNSSIAYNDQTMPSMTGQAMITDVAYVDRHTQPSWDHPGTLPTALQFFNGNIDLQTTKSIVQAHQTGDVHWAAYDYANQMMEVAIGRTNPDGNYYPVNSTKSDIWMAYNRPTVVFSLPDLWAGL
jgi:hypothetical protein